MSSRTKTTIATSLPPEKLAALDRLRRRDNLSRAQALREASWRYLAD